MSKKKSFTIKYTIMTHVSNSDFTQHSQFMNKMVSEIGCYRLVPLFRAWGGISGDGTSGQLDRPGAHL